MRRGERFLLALSICALVLPACTPPGADEEVSFRLPVTVREVGTGTVEDRVVATGTIRAPEAITLRAETPGVFMCARHPSGRRLAEGDRVEAGQKIGEVTGEDVRIAARTEANRQRFESARRDYESKQRLYDDGLISEVELRAAEDAMAEARVGLDRSLLTETRSVLTTPIAGVILRLARDEQGLPLADGQLVVQGAMLARSPQPISWSSTWTWSARTSHASPRGCGRGSGTTPGATAPSRAASRGWRRRSIRRPGRCAPRSRSGTRAACCFRACSSR